MLDLRKARILPGGNSKLDKTIGTFSKLMGDDIYVIDGESIQGSCGAYCGGCKNSCYVKHSYRYKSVIKGHAIRTLAMREDMRGLFNELDKQLTNKREPFIYVRIDQSGEIESAAEFIGWCNLAKAHPETTFYLYTKAFNIVIGLLLKGKAPDNMTVLISIWHEYGVAEFNRVKRLNNVKAFVYCDGYNYNKHGLNIETFCPAYNEAGKLDKSIKCGGRCKLCISGPVKVIGCYNH